MTTRHQASRSDRPRTERSGDDRPSFSGPRQGRRNLDEDVVALREHGQTYSAIARALGMKRAVNAQEAFVRAMRSLPDAQQKAVYRREWERLDQLEKRIRSRDTNEPVKMERRLVALEALRQTMA
jgi:hypothetical protein